MNPVRGDLVVRSKRVPFVGKIGIPQLDYSGGAFRMQVRPAAGQTGSALFQLATPAGGVGEGIVATFVTDLYNRTTKQVGPGTVITINIAVATLAGLPWGQVPPDEPLHLAYDWLVSLSGAPEQLFATGGVIFYPGVTI